MIQDRPVVSKNLNIPLLLAVGILIGVVSIVSPGSVFDLTLAAAIAVVIYLYSDPSERYFLVKLFLYGLLLRAVLLLAVQYALIHNNRWFYVKVFGGDTAYLFGDDGYYTLRGWGLTRHIDGAGLDSGVIKHIYRNYGYTFYLYMISLFYYLFGFSPISVTFINCIFGVLTGLVYYSIAKEIFDKRSARIAAILIVFFPSIIVWSISNLKDTIFMFLFGTILLAFTKLVKTGKAVYWVLFFASLFMQFLIRPKFILLASGIAAWGVFFYLYLKRKIKLEHIFLAIIALVLTWPVLAHKLLSLRRMLIGNNIGVVRTGGYCYKIYDDWVYDQNINTVMVSSRDMLIALLRGWVHFFLEPYPWMMQSTLSLIAFPQMIIWYLILPFSIIGFFVLLKADKRMAIALGVFLLSIGIIFALTGGNVGTDFRMRDMVSPLIMLFSAIGMSRIFKVRNDTKAG